MGDSEKAFLSLEDNYNAFNVQCCRLICSFSRVIVGMRGVVILEFPSQIISSIFLNNDVKF